MALPGAVLAGALVFAAVGAGRFSVDHLLIARQHTNQPNMA
jgi:uncharacterized membrane protein YphA (DoxX/SURF4 family)